MSTYVVAHILGVTDIESMWQPTLRLSDPEWRARLFEQLAAGLSDWTPPLIVEHTPGGSAEGYVVALWSDDSGLYGLVELISREAIAAMEAGAWRYVSIGMNLATDTEPARMWELSRVAIPAFSPGQQPVRLATADEVARHAPVPIARVAAARPRTLYTLAGSGTVPTTQPTQTEAGMDELIAQVAALTEQIAAMDGRLAALESAEAADDGDEMEMGAGMDPAADELEQLKAENYALAKLADHPQLSSLRGVLTKLARHDRAAADELIRQTVKLAKAGAPTAPRVPVTEPEPTTAAAQTATVPLTERARQIQLSRRSTGESVRWEDCIAAARAERGE